MDIKNVRNLFQKVYKENKGAMSSDDPNELKKVLKGENIALTDALILMQLKQDIPCGIFSAMLHCHP